MIKIERVDVVETVATATARKQLLAAEAAYAEAKMQYAAWQKMKRPRRADASYKVTVESSLVVALEKAQSAYLRA